jgi:hypothetical protein
MMPAIEAPLNPDRQDYHREIAAVLARILASFNDDVLSGTSGLGDRLYWAWKLTDFPNATPQGAVHGLAVLVAHKLLPWDLEPARMIARIDRAINACAGITARDGSLAEAFPNEKSFCVTALVAFDILCAADLLRNLAGQEKIQRWRAVAAPMIDFLKRYDEGHAVISNHLATAAAALFRWAEDGDQVAQDRAQALLARILAHQSPEGWFSEYGGFDPGYESLGLYYLADIHTRRSQPGLAAALERSLEFLRFAAHPDGSFGGLYGSRNTRFIVPAGLEMLAAEFPAAASLARFARAAIANRSVVTLCAMDDGNLAPMFNSYCRALAAAPAPAQEVPLPAQGADIWRRAFPCAGLVIDKGARHYTIVSTHKGGVISHFRDGKAQLNAGRAAHKHGALYTSQGTNPGNAVTESGDGLEITAPFTRATSETLTPAKLIVLRILCLSLFRSRPLGEIIKRILVRRLITGRHLSRASNRRVIHWGHDLTVRDEMTGEDGLRPIAEPGAFQAIHMASGGYWQAGDDRT